jgi:hypothetical protein
LAIVKYSTKTEAQFTDKFRRIAISVDIPSIIPMKNGPRSLQTRSIRLICEFIAMKRLETLSRSQNMTYFGVQ